MVEEAGVVVLPLERPDLLLDERVQRVERGLDVVGDGEVHAPTVRLAPRAAVTPSRRHAAGTVATGCSSGEVKCGRTARTASSAAASATAAATVVARSPITSAMRPWRSAPRG